MGAKHDGGAPVEGRWADMLMTRVTVQRLLALTLIVALSAPVQAQPSPILIGFTSSLSGSHAAYGLGLLHGARLAVARANAGGGVGGRPLELLVLDDAGDPQRAKSNARQLSERGVVALMGVYGSRATGAVATTLAPPGSDAAQLALVAPVTSADSLRDPPLPGVFHIRAGAAEEASAAVLHLDTIGITRYSLITQDDALGESGHEHLMLELARIAIRPLLSVRISTGVADGAVRQAVAKTCEEHPEALILAVDASTAATAIREAKARRCAAQYLVFSETGAALAAREAGASGPHPLAGVLVSQVMPHPNNTLHPLVMEYQRALVAQGGGEASYPSIEGYLAARVIQLALSNCVKEAARACLLHVLRSGTFDLPGLRVRFGNEQRQSRPFVEMTLLNSEGRFRR